MNRRMMQLGFGLILLALVTGLAIPAAPNPRLALAAHTVGLLGGLVLVVVGMLAGTFVLGAGASTVLTWSWVYATYANWVGCLLAAFTGASRLTPIAGAGVSGTGLAEGVVAIIFVSEGVAALIAAGLAVWGLRGRAEPTMPRAIGTENLRAVAPVRVG
jgi:(hydroxyamino)benzene mutase